MGVKASTAGAGASERLSGVTVSAASPRGASWTLAVLGLSMMTERGNLSAQQCEGKGCPPARSRARSRLDCIAAHVASIDRSIESAFLEHTAAASEPARRQAGPLLERASVCARMAEPRPIVRILDGGMGRELKARGAPFRQPEWSALALLESPAIVQETHEDFISAGAGVITSNSFAIVPFHIGEDRFREQGAALASLSGSLARAAVSSSGRPVLVAASLPPPCGAYLPSAFDPVSAARILGVLVKSLSPFADLWLAETLSSTAEARAAASAIREAALPGADARPLWLAFSLRRRAGDGAGPSCLHSGESIEAAACVARELGAAALLFNCAPPELLADALSISRAALGGDSAGIELGAYANSFREGHAEAPEPANSAITELRPELCPPKYAEFSRAWAAAGATILGGCCGIGPAHIAELGREHCGR